MSDDNKTIVHHKVAAKVFIVMNQDDVAASARSVFSLCRIRISSTDIVS